MINIKSKQQIKDITKSSKILAEVKQIIWDALKPGVTGLELDAIAEEEITKRGAKSSFKGYQGFKHTICISFNEEVIHGIPSKRKVKSGDIVKVDVGCIYNEMHSDSAFTKAIGSVSKKDKELIDVAKDSFYIGLNAIKKGARTGDIASAIGNYIKSKGYFVPESFSGHGIGKALHEEPNIYNEGIEGTGPLLKDGMVICIEPMILQGSNKIKIQKDKWTVVSLENKNTSHYEHTILIKNGKGIILTEGI